MDNNIQLLRNKETPISEPSNALITIDKVNEIITPTNNNRDITLLTNKEIPISDSSNAFIKTDKADKVNETITSTNINRNITTSGSLHISNIVNCNVTIYNTKQ